MYICQIRMRRIISNLLQSISSYHQTVRIRQQQKSHSKALKRCIWEELWRCFGSASKSASRHSVQPSAISTETSTIAFLSLNLQKASKDSKSRWVQRINSWSSNSLTKPKRASLITKTSAIWVTRGDWKLTQLTRCYKTIRTQARCRTTRARTRPDRLRAKSSKE